MQAKGLVALVLTTTRWLYLTLLYLFHLRCSISELWNTSLLKFHTSWRVWQLELPTHPYCYLVLFGLYYFFHLVTKRCMYRWQTFGVKVVDFGMHLHWLLHALVCVASWWYPWDGTRNDSDKICYQMNTSLLSDTTQEETKNKTKDCMSVLIRLEFSIELRGQLASTN